MIDPHLASFFVEIFFNPLYGEGYQFWSGIGSDIGEITIVAGIIALWKQHSCHVKGCYRPKWKEWEDTEHRVFGLCKKHHPKSPRYITHDDIERIVNGSAPRKKSTT